MFSLQAGIIYRFYKRKKYFSYWPLLLICFWAVISDGTLATLQIPQPGTFKMWACDCWSGECRATISSQDWNRPSNKPGYTHSYAKTGQGDPASGLGWPCEVEGLLQFQLSGSCIQNVHRFFVMVTFHTFFKTSSWSWWCSCLFQQLFFLSQLLYYFVYFSKTLSSPFLFHVLTCSELLHVNLLSLLIIWNITHSCYLLFAAVTYCLPTLVVGHK